MAINKTLQDKINQGRQYRSMVLNIEERKSDEDKYIVKGYATTFNEEYVLYSGEDWEYREKVDANAFDGCNMDDVIFQYDHEGRVYARISNNTLKLAIDEHGLYVEADLGGTEEGRKLYEEIQKGYTSKMSFGFTVTEDSETRTTTDGKDIYTRTILKIGRLYDVSAVSLPANDGTEISARSLIDGVINQRAQELSDKEHAEEERIKAEKETQDKAKKERDRLALELELSLSLKK